jgi:hypothetical protein
MAKTHTHIHTNQTNGRTKPGSQPTYPSTHPLTIPAPDPQKRNPSSTHPHLESRFSFTETQFPRTFQGGGGGGDSRGAAAGTAAGSLAAAVEASEAARVLSPSASPLQTACIFVDGSRSGVRRCQGGAVVMRCRGRVSWGSKGAASTPRAWWAFPNPPHCFCSMVLMNVLGARVSDCSMYFCFQFRVVVAGCSCTRATTRN